MKYTLAMRADWQRGNLTSTGDTANWVKPNDHDMATENRERKRDREIRFAAT